MARTLGRSVSDVEQSLTAAEFFQWAKHFDRFPIGDFYAQTLLANINLLLLQFFSEGKKGKHISEVAPWLEHTEDREKRKREEEKKKEQRNAAIFLAAD